MILYNGEDMNTTKTKLDARLLAVASCISDGAYLADVGTDHAYLPLYLAERGSISGAVASDIHKGPLERADKNIREAGRSEMIHTLLADGLQGIEAYPVTDIAIAGMGGLMIAGILEKADFIRKRPVKLILQPMQHIHELRDYLCKNGFDITKETQAMADGKFYQIICAVYDGEKREYNAAERLLGRYNIEHKEENRENFALLVGRQLDVLGEKIAGLQRGGHDIAALSALYEEIKNISPFSEKEKL